MLRPFSSVSRGHSFVLCGLHDLFSLFPIIPLRFAEPSFRILLCFLSILSCFFFAFSLVLCVFTLSSHFVHSLFIINCYTIFKLREQPLNNENAFTTHIDKFFHNSLGVPGTSGHSSFYGKHFPGCTAFSVKKECANGTFSRRGAVASATIYHCAECASLQALLAFME